MRASSLSLVLSVSLAAGCWAPPSGDLDPEETCALLGAAWSMSLFDPCPAGGSPGTAGLCPDAVEVHIEPLAASFDDATMDLAVCFTGEWSWTNLWGDARSGSLEALLESGLWPDASGVGFFSSDDGAAAACVGLTAGLSGSVEGGADFASGSYWWRHGTDPTDAEGDAWGGISAGAAALEIEPPPFLAPALGDPVLWLEEAAEGHFDDAGCDGLKADW